MKCPLLQLFEAILPEEAIDSTDVALEVSAGVGGQEAMLFCQEVFDMYQGFAEYMGWTTKLTDYETTDIGVYSLYSYEQYIYITHTHTNSSAMVVIF